MSNNGNPPQSAPDGAYQQLMLTRPIVNADGTMALWFAQWCQRLGGTVGGSTGSTTTTTITEQIAALTAAQGAAVAGGAPVDGATQSRLIALEQAARAAPLFPIWLAGNSIANEGGGAFVYDSTAGGTSYLRSIVSGGTNINGLVVTVATSGDTIVIDLAQMIPLTSNGNTLTTVGTVLTSG